MINSISHINYNSSYEPVKSKSNDKSDSEIKSLQSQEKELKAQIEQIRSDKSGGKGKKELIESLQEQVEQIESQIQQLQVSKSTSKMDDDSNSKLNNISNENIISKDPIANYISYGNIYDETRQTAAKAKNLKSKAAIAKSDIDFEENLSLPPNEKRIEGRRKEAAEDGARANMLDRKVAKLNKEGIDLGNKANEKESKVDRENYTAEGKTETDDLDKGKTIDAFA